MITNLLEVRHGPFFFYHQRQASRTRGGLLTTFVLIIPLAGYMNPLPRMYHNFLPLPWQKQAAIEAFWRAIVTGSGQDTPP